MLRKVTTTATMAAALSILAVPAFAQNGDNRNERAQGAPGYYCKQQGAEPKTQDFRECVREAAKARKRAENGDQSGGRENARVKGPARKFCQADRYRHEGADPGSKAFRQCVKFAREARQAARA